ncbi:MAG: damage-inducible protein, partial [Candidatus Poribacteria bacterium]|nr:damage-inducible protein [Candidatus Poribacteria bacterium]
IASVNIEEAFRGQRGGDKEYEPFEGIILMDTFNLNKPEGPTLFPKERMVQNNERAEKQQGLEIEVIVGNPPWSAGQKDAVDDNPNVKYPELEQRITDTYASCAAATLKRYLFDTYKMAIRWASDRIKDQTQGVVAFVTPASWIDGNADAGIRACLPEEFHSIYVLNLLGNARIHDKDGKYHQGEGVFGNATQSPVAINLLVKNTTHDENKEHCRIYYRDIGSNLKRQEKLQKLTETTSISGFKDWQEITPNQHYDWINQRNDVFARFYPLGTTEAKAGKADNAIFQLYSLGMSTNRDAYVYNFSRKVCVENAWQMTQKYLAAISELEENPEFSVDEVVRLHSTNIKWENTLKNRLKQKKKTEFTDNYIRKVAYRPFVVTNCYADYTFITRKGQMDQIFPDSSSENHVICIPSKGGNTPFYPLITDRLPDLHFTEASQCFPRWRYQKPTHVSDTSESQKILNIRGMGADRIDNISDTALRTFRNHYKDDAFTKDDIFDYVYGILHAPSYREQFANDLSKMLPRIPYAPDFYAFAEAGAVLASLHLNYETCERYPDLKVEPIKSSLLWEEKPEHFLLGTRAMRFADKETKTTLIINEHVQLSGVPEEAHRYVVNGRTPLEWFINRYKIKKDKNSGIINDPNGWFKNPRDLITAIERIVHVSVESTKIIEALPSEITVN